MAASDLTTNGNVPYSEDVLAPLGHGPICDDSLNKTKAEIVVTEVEVEEEDRRGIDPALIKELKSKAVDLPWCYEYEKMISGVKYVHCLNSTNSNTADDSPFPVFRSRTRTSSKIESSQFRLFWQP